jgi:hypothetical protein
VKLASLDIYPYSHEVGASMVHEYLPELKNIAMRPHKSEYFFHGLALEHFPSFSNLQSLNLDSFNFVDQAQFPSGLKNLDWQCRNENSLNQFIGRLEPLRQLEYLTIGHANLDSLHFLRLIQSIGSWNMGSLAYLVGILQQNH